MTWFCVFCGGEIRPGTLFKMILDNKSAHFKCPEKSIIDEFLEDLKKYTYLSWNSQNKSFWLIKDIDEFSPEGEVSFKDMLNNAATVEINLRGRLSDG